MAAILPAYTQHDDGATKGAISPDLTSMLPQNKSTSNLIRKPLIVELEAVTSKPIDPFYGPPILGGKALRKATDVVMFDSGMKFIDLQNAAYTRAGETGITPHIPPGGSHYLNIRVLVDGASVLLESANWEAGKSLLMKDGAKLKFLCAGVKRRSRAVGALQCVLM